jgi:hypothetical protein
MTIAHIHGAKARTNVNSSYAANKLDKWTNRLCLARGNRLFQIVLLD